MKPFILAGDRREACEIAELAGIGHVSQWRYVDNRDSFRGYHGRSVLVTGMDCWRRGRPSGEAAGISQSLVIGDFKVLLVPCPPDWKASGFTLPAGWDVPKEYRTSSPPRPKVRWWQGWFSWLFRGQS